MTEASALRSFIAVPVPAAGQHQIAALQALLRRILPSVKTLRAQNLHLTLHFLGDQTEEQLAKIGQTMLSIGRKKTIFNVELTGLRFFPNRQRPRILCLGLKPQQPLVELYQQLASELNKLGLKTDKRPYRPHVTIARWVGPATQTARLCPFLTHSCGSLQVDKMILFSSKLTSQGAIYTPQTCAPLIEGRC